jgi:hypothetical protein
MPSRHATVNRALAHRSQQTVGLGCPGCPLFGLCGGVKISAAFFNCDSLCECADRDRCPHVCRNKPEEYVRRHREVDGFGLDNVGQAPPLPSPPLPAVIPLVYGRSRLSAPIHAGAVAVPMHRLFHGKTGAAHAASRGHLAAKFRLRPDAKLVVTGVSTDQPIEHYWSRARGAGLPEKLAALRPDLVTTPNFSLFSNVPREDNLYNMKRLAVCWYELAALHVPTALHVNARTDRDWERWGEFLRAHPEIAWVAFEFRTGAATKERGRWYVAKLCALARGAGRPLRLVVRGGRGHLADLRQSFHSVSFVTPVPFVKTQKRQRLTWRPGGGGRGQWVPAPTRRGAPLDRLLRHNIDTFAQMLAEQARGGRA